MMGGATQAVVFPGANGGGQLQEAQSGCSELFRLSAGSAFAALDDGIA